MKFPKGTRVMRDFTRSNYRSRNERGVTTVDSVIDPLSNQEKTLVKWDHGYSHPAEVYTAGLILESEGDKKASDLEKEYEELERKCVKKIEVAVKAISEARKLAADKGYCLSSMGEAGGMLLDAISDAGWSTSSWSC